MCYLKSFYFLVNISVHLHLNSVNSILYLQLSKFRQPSIKIGKYTLTKIKRAKVQNRITVIMFIVSNKIYCIQYLLPL